jgi:hypothetical protein
MTSIKEAYGALGGLSILLLGLAACGSHGSPSKDSGADRGGDSSAAGAGGSDAGAGTGGETAGAGGAAGADASAGAAGADASAGSGGGAAGADASAGADGGGDGAAGATVNTCGASDGGASDAGADGGLANDVLNCGRVGRACGAGATCNNGLCDATVILKPDVASNWCDGVFSATKAYMVTCWGTELSEVRVAPLEPGASVVGTRIKSYVGVPVVALRGILIDGDSVYYGLEGAPSNLWKFPLEATGPADVTSASTFEDATRFDSLRLVGDTYWWTDNSHTAAGQIRPSEIKKRAKTGTASTTVFSLPGLSVGLVVGTSHLYWLDVRTAGATAVYMAPITGGTVTDTKKVADAVGGQLVRQGGYIYWTNRAAAPNGSVMRLKLDDDAATPEPVATCLNMPTGLAADASHVYFRQANALYRAPVTGGVAQQLSPPVPANDPQANAIFHVDDKYVYFAAGATAGASTLVRVAK